MGILCSSIGPSLLGLVPCDRRSTPLLALLVLASAAPLAGQRKGGGQTATPGSQLPAPTGVLVSWSNGAAVTAWQPVSGAVGYVVDHATAPGGPWTRVTPAPITATVFAHYVTAAPGTLLYYRVMAESQGAARSLVDGLPAQVGLVRPVPQAPRGVGVRQVGTTAVVSWYPVPHASGYRVKSPDPKRVPDVRVGPLVRSAAITITTTGYEQPFDVVAEFEPGVVTNAQTLPFPLGDPALCWPTTRLVGAGPAYMKATTSGGDVILTFEPVSGGVAYLVERTLAVNQGNPAAWESVACLQPITGMVRDFADRSHSLQQGQQYAYRVTAFTGAGEAGWQVALVDVPLFRNPSSVSLKQNGGAIDLFWPSTPGALAYLVETSYGYWEIVPASLSATMQKQLWGAPPGTHTFDVSSLYQGNMPGIGSPTRSSPLVIP